jgi:hypothetical protein
MAVLWNVQRVLCWKFTDVSKVAKNAWVDADG